MLYGIMALAAWAWCAYQGRPDPFSVIETSFGFRPPQAHAISAGLGLLLGGVTVGFSRLATSRWRAFRALQRGFGEMLEGLTKREVLVLALTSSFGEELLFRGAMQPEIGLLLTSLIFGGVHFIPQRRFAVWTLWAVVMGLLLGGIFTVTGSLVGCVAAHFIINYLNLRTIASLTEPPGGA